MQYFKWFVLIVFSLVFTGFIFLKYTVYSMNLFFDEQDKVIKNDIEKLQSDYISTSKQIIKNGNDLFKIKVPVSKPKTSTYEYTASRKSTVSDKDKACNAAIFRAMSDKSKEAQDNKLSLCSHNID